MLLEAALRKIYVLSVKPRPIVLIPSQNFNRQQKDQFPNRNFLFASKIRSIKPIFMKRSLTSSTKSLASCSPSLPSPFSAIFETKPARCRKDVALKTVRFQLKNWNPDPAFYSKRQCLTAAKCTCVGGACGCQQMLQLSRPLGRVPAPKSAVIFA